MGRWAQQLAVIWVASIMIGTLGGAGCASGNARTEPLPLAAHAPILQNELDALRQQLYATSKYPAENPAGLMLYISRGDEELLLSSNMTAQPELSNRVHFRIASATKTFTAAAIMLLYQRHQLDLDAKLTDRIPGRDWTYLPTTAAYNLPNKDQITIRQLLRHTSGVWDPGDVETPADIDAPYAGSNYTSFVKAQDPVTTFTVDMLAAVASQHQLTYGPPGTPGYSNFGYSLLSKIVERVAMMSFDDFIRKNFLEPNQLNDTTLLASGTQLYLPEPFIRGYVWSEKEQRFKLWHAANLTGYRAAGDMISTPRDLTRWLRRLYRGEAGLSRETVAMMIRPEYGTYGLGSMIVQQRAFGHNGALNGYFTLNLYAPESDTSWTLISNFAKFDDDFGGQVAAMEAFEISMLDLLENKRRILQP